MSAHDALLPSGFHDVLPPDARAEAQLISGLLSCFASFGYEQVRPPLVEFEESLLSGRSIALSPQVFRVMDPQSGRMMGFRSDMTYQVARIARTRLGKAARPLRLSYAGAILHVASDALRPERQLYQAGFELIGAKGWESDAEVMLVAAESLLRAGFKGISLDLNLPSLVAHFIGQEDRDETVAEAIRRKNANALPSTYAHRETVAALMKAAGPAKSALARLGDPSMPKIVRTESARLVPIVEQLSRWLPDLPLTLDPLEHRSFLTHQGVSFSIFVEGLRHEAGRGGRYASDEKTEACGFTLDVTHLLRLLPAPEKAAHKKLAISTPLEDIRKLQEQGTTVTLS